jgi:phenylpropionate dioxygenase-like ring-hydroxylating dioxygenase large terminal subunit
VDEAVSDFREASGGLVDYWYAACLSTELKKAPLQRMIFDEPIALFRSDDGKAYATIDRCLHRNSFLSAGHVHAGCLVCPYHGWTFDKDGACANIPSEGIDGAPARERKLRTFPVIERYGLVWVWTGRGAPDKEPFPMPHWGERGWGAYYMVTPFANGVTQLVENFMDVPHTVFVHEGWFRTRKRQKVPTHVERTKDSVLVTYRQERDTIGFTELVLNPQRKPMVHTDKFYMPNNTRVDYVYGGGARAFVITSTCTPIRPYESLVFTLISYKLGVLQQPAKYLLPFYTRKVIHQDVEIMAVQGAALKHFGDEKFSSSPADTMHLYIESLRRHAQHGGEAPPAVVKEIEFWI